jgi:2,4-dichlorophenol 6-monooxygenase
VERDGARVSTLDLVAHDRFTLIAGPGVSARIAEGVERSLRVLVAGRDFTDPDGRWTTLGAIGDQGALLVRPDQHVAWRASAAVPGTEGELARTLARVLDRS